MTVYHYKKWGGGIKKVLAMQKGGHTNSWGSLYAVALVLAIFKGGGAKSVHSLKGRGGRFTLS